jgi:hypothetical protein
MSPGKLLHQPQRHQRKARSRAGLFNFAQRLHLFGRQSVSIDGLLAESETAKAALFDTAVNVE